jgi:transposase
MELILEKAQLELLKELQRNTSDRDTYQRLTTLLMLHNKFSGQQISENLGIDTSTVNRHYHQYVASKNFDTYLERHYKPCRGKLTEAQLQAVKSYVESNICHSSLEVLSYISTTFLVVYKPDSVIALLHRLGFVYKKTKLIPSKANIKKQEEFIGEFRKIECNLPENEVILFGDGVDPHYNTEPTYAWIEKGKDKEILSNTGRVRVNINGAINPAKPTEIVYYECHTINAISTVVWLKLIEAAYPQKKKIHLYVDNARYYRSKLVSEFLLNSPIEMHFLPPYSPNLNPIERLWKFTKKEVIKSHYTPDANIFKERIRNFFANIGNYKDKLESLINTNFQKLNQQPVGLQTYLI